MSQGWNRRPGASSFRLLSEIAGLDCEFTYEYLSHVITGRPWHHRAGGPDHLYSMAYNWNSWWALVCSEHTYTMV